MKVKFTVILFFLLPQFVYAQLHIDRPPLSINSLKQVLPLLHDKAKVDCLYELSRAYCDRMTLAYTDSALQKLSEAYKEASAINYIKGLGDACIQYGVIYTWLLPNYKKCEKYYREAISWYERIHYDNGLGFGFRGLGMIFFNQGIVEEALKAGVDILWVGARSTVNPFTVQEIADALKGVDVPVMVKNPVNPDLSLWIGALERINNAGITKLAAIHRGFCAVMARRSKVDRADSFREALVECS